MCEGGVKQEVRQSGGWPRNEAGWADVVEYLAPVKIYGSQMTRDENPFHI